MEMDLPEREDWEGRPCARSVRPDQACCLEGAGKPNAPHEEVLTADVVMTS